MVFEAIDWHMLASVTVVVCFLGGIAIILIRSRLSRDFAPIHSHASLARSHGELKEEVGKLHLKLANVPGHNDLADMSRRVSGVETGMAGVQATMTALNGQMIGVAKDVRMLLEHALDGEKP